MFKETRDSPSKDFFSYKHLNATSSQDLYQGATYEGKKILRFVTQKPLSKFKELIVTSPMLLRGLHTMSMTKTAPDGLKARECKQIKLREPPPVPYVPVKDKV